MGGVSSDIKIIVSLGIWGLLTYSLPKATQSGVIGPQYSFEQIIFAILSFIFTFPENNYHVMLP